MGNLGKKWAIYNQDLYSIIINSNSILFETLYLISLKLNKQVFSFSFQIQIHIINVDIWMTILFQCLFNKTDIIHHINN